MQLTFSGQLINILKTHGYASVDQKTGLPRVHLTRLVKEQSIQSVARWMTRGQIDNYGYMPATDVLMGELRQHLEAAGLKMLRDEAETEIEYERTQGFMSFLRKREKPKTYPAGTVLDARGNPVR